MIYATDQNKDWGFTTHWHCPPPPHGVGFIVARQEWEPGWRAVRHIYGWHFQDMPVPDPQGWLPVPAWLREMAG